MAHLSNPLATAEQLYRRSSLSSLPTDILDTIFFATQCLTQAAGLLLQLPQSTTAQANVLIARFWLVEPVMLHEFSVSLGILHSGIYTAPLTSLPPLRLRTSLPPPST